MKFEDSLKELDAIIEKLESGKLSIDESIALYGKGLELCNECGKKLNDVKGKIVLLEESAEGLREKPVEVE